MNITHVDYPAPAFAMSPRPSAITDLIYHHEAGSLTETPLQIDMQHRGEGWAMIGYNYIIGTDGTVYDGRPLDVIPSAAYGRNSQSVNVSLVGNFELNDPGYTGPPTAAQIQACIDLGVYLHQQIPSIERTIGHRDVATLFYGGDGNYATACPGSEFYKQLGTIKAAIAVKINPSH
jgi:hypothetical protein